MEPARDPLLATTRRHFFSRSASGIGGLALASLMNRGLFAGDAAGPIGTHFAPKAKRVIYLFMAGAPSHLDLLDNKPKLVEHNGQPIPDEFTKGERFAFIKGTPKLLGSPHKYEKHGQSGAEISALLPHLAKIADDIAIVRSGVTDAFNHAPAQIFLNTGSTQIGRPSMGAWLTYGLGSESEDLPGFVVLQSGGGQPDGGTSCWSSGFLPTRFQGVPFRSQGDPVLFLSNPKGMDAPGRRRSLDALNDLNRHHLADAGDPEISTRIAAFEMAFRMQSSAPDLIDIAREPASVHAMYGTEPGKASFANNCLLARRLVERGVRFVQLYHRGWDNHGNSQDNDILTGLPARCKEVDRPAAALVADLKRTGLLDETLVIWGGEFGRTPMNEARNGSVFLGRDHHPHAFSFWMAGGGIKPGTTVGTTDELGYRVVEDRVHVHDLQATILHLMGIDHTRLTYKFQGRDFRLTDVHGAVVPKLLA
ncbi:DUF1501 domain-containing protein [Tundrisphaera sp. TA3]|uniref:DUF1501 domain-containing protein n=1 Tax=Tundrisphaera sp. TA3 TaxID=3435775 RepID=UPI003EBC9E18